MLAPILDARAPAHVLDYKPADRAAAIAISTAAYLSGILVFLLLLHILVVGLLPYIRRGSKYSEDGERAFLWRPIGALVTSLLFSNLLQSFSGTLQVRWAVKHGVHTGWYCTTQAALLLSADVGVSIFSALVAAHTFSTVALHKSWSSVVLWILIVLTWAIMLVVGLIGPFALASPARGPFYGISLDWCFITNAYSSERIHLHYVPILVCGTAILILYSLVFFTVRGSLSIYNYRFGSGFRALFPRAAGSFSEAQLPSATLANSANKMLWYPAAYIVIILPITTARLCAQTGKHVPEWAWYLGIIFLHLSGAVNVVIYTSTRRALSPIAWARRGSGASTIGLWKGSVLATKGEPPGLPNPVSSSNSPVSKVPTSV